MTGKGAGKGAPPDKDKPPAFVRVFTLRFEHPELGFDVVEQENKRGLQVMNVAENMVAVGLKNGFKILELGSYNMREASLADWESRIRRCKLPLRVRFKSLPLSKDDEKKFRDEIAAKSQVTATTPKPPKPPDPMIVYCGVAWILILFAMCTYISMMGFPQSLPNVKSMWTPSPRSSRSHSRGDDGPALSDRSWFSNLFSSTPAGPQPLHKTSFVTLEELYAGGKITFHPGQLQKICSHCKGTGAEHGHKHNMDTCDMCHGTGVIPEKKPGFLGFETTQEKECPKCGGKGYTVAKKCPHCDGKGVTTSDEEISLMLPMGTQHGQKLRLRGLGHQILGYPPGDIILEIRQKPHGRFKRRGQDLSTELKISLPEALTGFSKKIAHLDGHTVDVESDKIVNQKTRLTVPGQGMKTRDGRAGDLIVRLKIIFPKDMSKAKGASSKKYLREKEGEPALNEAEAEKEGLTRHDEL